MQPASNTEAQAISATAGGEGVVVIVQQEPPRFAPGIGECVSPSVSDPGLTLIHRGDSA